MSFPITLFTTSSRQKELFVPLDESLVRIYTCWPTVYGDPHIGNMRAYVFADVLRQTLQHIWWYTLKHITNITDVGHLTDDGDQGEDKMEKWARKEWKTVWEVARMYEENFLSYSDALGIERFDEYAKATEHIAEQIAMVKQLEDKWFTYEIAGDGIYMDTEIADKKLKWGYWKMSQLDFDHMCNECRTEWAIIDVSKKRLPTDFALWKFSPTNKKRAMEWESPWWVWFPGRHIECSAMATANLWEKIDIHTGGIDHISIHHTNEIAQTECALGITDRVKYRMHCQFLQIDGSKVSKSKWDDLSIPGILDKWFDPLDLRYFYMTGHYRNFLDFTWEALEAARTSRKNMIKKIASVDEIVWIVSTWELYVELAETLADDLDTVKTLSLMHKQLADASPQDIYDILSIDDQILKLWLRAWVKELYAQKNNILQIPSEIQELAEKRSLAKKEKDYAAADRLRDVLAEAGRVASDTLDGYVLERISS